MTGPSPEQTRRADAFDEIAALFLTEKASPVEAPALREPAFRELLIVGNLPVRGGVWLTPYADAIARDNGPTALVRFDLEPPTLELLLGSGAKTDERPHRAANGEIGAKPMTLRDAVYRAASEVAVWIVRGPARTKPADLLSLEFDRVTILTSADSAAVVAAYQIIKDIITCAADDEALVLPRIAVAIAGADERDAAEVAKRLNETTSSRLGVSVELAHCLTRMDAGIRCETFASFVENDAPTVRDLLEWIDTAAGEEAWERVGEVAAAPAVADDDDAEDDRSGRPPLRLAPLIDDEPDEAEDEGEPLLDEDDWMDEALNMNEAHDDPPDVVDVLDKEDAMPMPEIETIAQEPAARPTVVEGANRNGVRLAPKPSAPSLREPATPQPSMHDGAMTLATFVAGLSPLPVRCPAHEEIELASDEAGRVHVLAREGSLRELRIVENWARAHRRLLAMACADRGLDTTDEVLCHIFTDKPATLADLHGTGLRLHVLAPVQVGNETAWYAAPLSR